MQAKWGISVVSQPSSQRAWKSSACVKSMDRTSGSKTTGPVTVFSASVKLTFVSCSVSWGHCLYLGMAPQCLQQIMESQDICFISFITLQTCWQLLVRHWYSELRWRAQEGQSAVTWCPPADTSVLVEHTLLWLVCESWWETRAKHVRWRAVFSRLIVSSWSKVSS